LRRDDESEWRELVAQGPLPPSPPLAGEGQGGAIKIRTYAPSPTLPRKRGREHTEMVARGYVPILVDLSPLTKRIEKLVSAV